MKSFKCSTCGYRYNNSHNFTSCPRCMGLGKPDKNCLCTYWRQAFSGIKMNIIHTKNPKCPIHGVKQKTKIFVAYRHSGEDLKKIKEILKRIVIVLNSRSYDAYCALFEFDSLVNKGMVVDEIYKYCEEKLLEHNTILFFIKSEDYSKGMKAELDLAVEHNKKIIVAIREGLDFSDFRKQASRVVEFKDLDDLYETLNRTDFCS